MESKQSHMIVLIKYLHVTSNPNAPQTTKYLESSPPRVTAKLVHRQAVQSTQHTCIALLPASLASLLLSPSLTLKVNSMAKSLVVPLGSKAAPPTNTKNRFLYPNCPSNVVSQSVRFEKKGVKNLKNALFVSHYTLASLHRQLTPLPALPHQGAGDFRSSEGFEQWNSLTAQFSGAANIPFTLLQLPQIILNARNLLAGNKTALLAVPWLGMLTGLLGNLSLLSYFAKKREKEAVVVQTLGVVSTYVVIVQLAMAEAMPLPIFVITSVVVASGLFLNLLNFLNWLNAGVWQFWEDFITVGGMTVLPQVMWSTFVPYVPNTILPGTIACAVGVAAVVMARIGKLPEKGVKFVGAISGWTATLLFMWMPVSQMWTNFLNPDNIKGLSAVSMLLAMIGNGLMIPRALFIRDFMWFTGSTWAALLYGYGNIVCLYWFKVIKREFFLAATAGLISWLGMALWRDTVVYGYNSPLRSLRELVFGN